MTYYDNLTKDKKRVSVFKKAITENAKGIVYDLGTGSGILAEFASKKAKKVYAYEINPLVIKHYAKSNLEKYDNITLIEADLTNYNFKQKADVVICEMLDTALIDEEQALVINNVIKYTRENTIFIPHSTHDTIKLGYSNINNITYLENNKPYFESFSQEKIYNKTCFQKHIKLHFKKDIKLRITKTGIIDSIQLTTYTHVTKELLLNPTPMLNPPLLIPIEKTSVCEDENITIHLEYTMGGGLNTIKANIR